MEYHNPVLLQASVDGLNIKPDGIYIDGTFGRGGHSRFILDQLGEHGLLIAFDKDIEAITQYYQCNYTRAAEILSIINKEELDLLNNKLQKGGVIKK